ncbi:hydrophobin 3 precursor [Fusarium sporotrichioides]|uniref:Hydrophobin 3 n=1 Tax=Fusarium sporotrichioides TaxID=5514 RepID=A0A395RGH3_FUSSP|nr:hydrophobin 3 precursor [Fusarium sporotrichioides]
MQFSTFTAVFAMAAAAIAAPTEIEARTDGGHNNVCSTQNNQVCCQGLLNCAVQVLGAGCSGGNSYCCKTDAPVGALINVALLNCVKLL